MAHTLGRGGRPVVAPQHDPGRLLLKLSARDRAQLVVCAYECGLVVPGR